MTGTAIIPPGTQPKEVTAAMALIPYRRDDLRAKYLGWLSSGFSDEEALFVLGLNTRWLELMRQDEKFAELEERIPEFRRELSREYNDLDFNRNFRMVLEIDHRVLRKSLGIDKEFDEETGEEIPVELTPFEQQYLIKLRGAYTPQQLQLLESIAKGNDKGINFAEWVRDHQNEIIQFRRVDTVSIRGGDAETPDDS